MGDFAFTRAKTFERLPHFSNNDISLWAPFMWSSEAVDYSIDGHAVGLGPIAKQDAMPQGGMDQLRQMSSGST